MAVIGGVFIVTAVFIGGFCLWAGSAQTAPAALVDVFGNTISITPVTMFVLGALAMMFLLLGMWLALSATRRSVRSHRERRMLEKREQEQAAELAETRARLAATTGKRPALPDPASGNASAARAGSGPATGGSGARDGGASGGSGRAGSGPAADPAGSPAGAGVREAGRPRRGPGN